MHSTLTCSAAGDFSFVSYSVLFAGVEQELTATSWEPCWALTSMGLPGAAQGTSAQSKNPV